jgi:hypothetical protein
MNKTTESLSLQNLHRTQIKNGGQNLRLFRRKELRKQHILWNHSLKKMLMKMTTRLRQRTGKSTTTSTTASERERKIREPAGGKEKSFIKTRET